MCGNDLNVVKKKVQEEAEEEAQAAATQSGDFGESKYEEVVMENKEQVDDVLEEPGKAESDMIENTGAEKGRAGQCVIKAPRTP